MIQIGCISFDGLTSPEKAAWLENLSDEFNRCFVEVTDGDGSIVRDFDEEIFTIDDLIDSEYCAGSYAYIDKTLTEASDIAKLDAARKRTNAAWSGMLGFYPVED